MNSIRYGTWIQVGSVESFLIFCFCFNVCSDRVYAADLNDLKSETCQQVLAVFYNPAMSVEENHSFSPSAGKPRLFIEALRNSDIPHDIIESGPISTEDLMRVHDKRYVSDVLAGREFNGFGNRSLAVARSLVFTSGSLAAAADYALRRWLACSPSSGFHHAGVQHASGFCTFNGLMAVGTKLIVSGKISRVAIIDADQHYGNGTDEMIAVSPFREKIFHYSFGREFEDKRSATHTKKYFESILHLEDELEDFSPDLIIYQAGADVHKNDPLGGLLTTEEILQRDREIFQIAARIRAPIVWNLAGGYQRSPDGGISKVLEIHLNTARASLDAFEKTLRVPHEPH